MNKKFILEYYLQRRKKKKKMDNFNSNCDYIDSRYYNSIKY